MQRPEVARTSDDNLILEYRELLVEELIALPYEAMSNIVTTLKTAKGLCSTVFILGNGGSCANASHLVLHLREINFFAVDLLADLPYLTALSNDFDYDSAPAKRLQRESSPGDVLVVLSGSGKSINVIHALVAAKSRTMHTIGLLGFGGGVAKLLCDHSIVLHSHDYGIVEDCHSTVIHLLKRLLEVTNS